MTNPIPWVLFVAKALDYVLDLAEAAGIDPPGADEAERLLAEVNAQVAKGLGPSAIALNMAVQLAKARADAKIASLGEDPRCPNFVVEGEVARPCGAVLEQHVSKPIDGSEPTRSYSCDACGWRSA
jgi:hypothetical protein